MKYLKILLGSLRLIRSCYQLGSDKGFRCF